MLNRNYKLSKNHMFHLNTTDGANYGESYIINGNIKCFNIVKSNGYTIYAYGKDHEADGELKFSFEQNHPLYNAFIRLLNGQSFIRLNKLEHDTFDDYCFLEYDEKTKKIILTFANYLFNKKYASNKNNYCLTDIGVTSENRNDVELNDNLFMFFEDIIKTIKSYNDNSMEKNLVKNY